MQNKITVAALGERAAQGTQNEQYNSRDGEGGTAQS